MIETIKTILENTQNRTPMVHSITNNVTINDCANIILAAGGTAIMAQDEREVEEITSHAPALVLNMGAVRAQEAMLSAAKIARRNGNPVVLDPVAAGASTLRREMCSRLLSENLVSVIRGNASEVRALAAGAEQETGVKQCARQRDRGQFTGIRSVAAVVQPPDRSCCHAHRRDGCNYRWNPYLQWCAAAVRICGGSPAQAVCSPR